MPFPSKMSNEEPKDMKEVLAPAEGLREDLIATAVKFLQNPKVTQSPLSQKRAFLERKGLTTEEAEAAISRSGISRTETPAPPPHTAYTAPLVPSPGPTLPPRIHDHLYSRWTRTRDVLAVVTMITGISYAAYRLYKEFLRPWLFGLPTAQSRLDKMETSVSEALTKVTATLSSLQETLTSQKERLQTLSNDLYSKTGTHTASSLQSSQSITEIKQELASIKGLLLNRRQFPPVPNTTPVLPSWQLASSGDTTPKEIGSATVTMATSPAPGSPVKLDVETTDEQEGSSLVAADGHMERDGTPQLVCSETETVNKTLDSPNVDAVHVEKEAGVQIKTGLFQNEAVVQNEADVVQNEAVGLQNEAVVVQNEENALQNEADKIQNEVELKGQGQESEVTVSVMEDSTKTKENM